MDKIFISYRREDTEGFARSLFQSLVRRFGKDKVFMDVEAIGLGMDFVEAIDQSLADCGALLVLIGKDWVDCKDAAGIRRLEKDDDFVRTEVAKAIERNVRVIPVLVRGAPMPDAGTLPHELRSLTRRQALELRHERWDPDVEQLSSSLETALGLKRLDQGGATPSPDPVPPEPRKRSKMPMVMMAMAVVILILGTVVYNQFIDNDVVVVAPPMEPNTTSEPSPTLPAAVKPVPAPPATPAPAPKPARVTHITGVWIDDDGARVEIVQTGATAFSQGIDPASGVLIQANWRLSGRQCEFTWSAASGNQGYGKGIISADYKVINYEFIDYTTGIQDTGRLVRTAQ